MPTKILRSASLICTSVIVLLCQWMIVKGQDERHPQRGFNPGASYALSQIETIGMSSGNLMLQVPLGSLPPGRGGSPGFTLGLTYNSKLYDSHIEQVPNELGEEENLSYLNDSQDGGWRYTLPGGYAMRVVSRFEEEPGPPCASGVSSYEYQKNSFIWKMRVIYPDGSSHDFRPVGLTDQFADGFFNISPNGWIFGDSLAGEPPSCTHGEALATTGPMVYYSTDGSYTRLVVEHDTNPADHAGGDNQWTLYFADGRRVSNEPNQPQRTYDRNNHYVEMVSMLHNNHPAYGVMDELGRSILIETDSQYDPNTGLFSRLDYIYVKGSGGEEMRWTVHWKEIYVYKHYKATIQSGSHQRGNSYLTPLVMVFLVVDQITLPTQAGGLTYSFGYNAGDCIGDCGSQQILSYGWGELSSVTLPSGVKASYTYALDGVTANESSIIPATKNVLNNKPNRKQQVYRPEYDLSTAISNTPCDPSIETCITEIWQYGPQVQPGATLSTNTRHISSIAGPDGGVYSEAFESDPNSPYNGRTLWSVQPDGTKVENLWRENRAPGMNGVSVNPFIKTVFTSIKDAAGNYAKTAIKDYDYDKNGNVTRVAEYDWVLYASVPREPITDRPTGIPGGLSPKGVSVSAIYGATPDALNTTTDDPDIYHHVSAPQLLGSVQSTEVGDGGSQPLARTELFYDNPSTTGNLTERRTWDSQKGAYSNPLSSSNSISVTNQFDPLVLGKLTQTTDARGFRTEYTYGLINGFSDLYPTETRVAAGTTVQRRTTAEYDFYTGLVTRATDADNNVSTATTYDVLGRSILVKTAEGKPEETRTVTEYSDTLRRVIVRSDLNALGDGKLVGVQHYDQLGRVRLSRQLEDAATQSATDETQGIKVQTRYVFSGSNSYVLTSNPYRAANSSSAGSENTMGWARSTSDNGGRLIEVQTFGGSGLPAPWGANATSTGTVTSAYDANFTTVTDQTGKVRRSMTDGLGRLVRVDEPDKDTGVLGSTDSPGQPTDYLYDATGNLRQVVQGQQQRFFMYDSLSRLIRAANPEQQTNPSLAITDPITSNSQWCMAYDYDDNGNLASKTDARGIVSTYVYDGLNRVTNRSYQNDPSVTPAVTYLYDPNIANGKGRLASVSSSVSTYTYGSYDAMGRVLNGSQTLGSRIYSMTYTYDRAGHVVTERYPSDRTVTYAYDSAGRANNMTGNLGDDTTRTYATGITYGPGGQMTQEQFGTTTPVFNKLFYNSRGQLAEILAATTGNDTGWNRGKIVNDYSLQCGGVTCNPTDNNGNLRKQSVYIPNDDQNTSSTSWYQQYDYDNLNRLSKVREFNSGGTLLWQQGYVFDRYGNRTIDQAITSDGIPKPNFGVDTNTNRLSVPAGYSGVMSYDNAGNLTTDTYSGAAVMRAYDAENRMTSETQANNYDAGSYTYDGDGRRVKRIADGTETWQVYGLGGELLAEYAVNAAPSSPQKEYGYRNGQLLIIATAPSGLAANTASDTNTNAVAAASPGSGTESTTTAQSFDLLASIKGLMLRLSGTSTVTSVSTEAVSDTSTPLYGPSFPYASLSSSVLPLTPQSGSVKIAFASNRDGTAQLYAMNTDGSGLLQLTNDAANDEAPNWSPNNSRIVFQSDRDNLFSGSADIYVMNWDGSGQTRLTSDANDDSAPVWSPDGTKIAFQSARNSVNYQVYVMNADGSGQVNISNSTANDAQPSWSPDGTKIAFTSDRDHTGTASVYVMNANGSNQTRLTFSDSAFRDEQPVWSPDGLKLLFTSTRDSVIDTWQETDDEGGIPTRTAVRSNKEVYLMNADGSAALRLTNTLENDDSPAWSGDGTKIVFRSERERDCCDPTQQVWVMNPDGSNQVNLSDNPYGDHCPSWQHISSNVPPAVSFTSPANGASFIAPANITITANASDSDGTIAKVDFYEGAILIGTDTMAPYSFTWNSVSAGSYSLTAKATDNIGATSTSGIVTVGVNAAPTVSVSGPVNGASFTAPANITITATASDSDGSISQVDFYQGTTLIGTDTVAPYSLGWNNIAAGSYSLTARATDNNGATSTSAAVNITVNVVPTVSVTSPVNGAGFTAPANITISASASDSDGTISKVDFYQGTTLIGTDTAAPYSFNWNNVAAGNYALTARATDNGGATSTSAAVSVTVNASPAVSITSPANGASFTALANITITANASDSDGSISRVDFYQGTTLIETDATTPYTITWNNVGAGGYVLTAKAIDNLGAITNSNPINITVGSPPAVSITSPANGASFTAPANVTITANASDSNGTISNVDFYQGTTLLGTDTTAPYSFVWNNVAAGSYALIATATDNDGTTSTSGTVTLSVNAAPTVSITSPANGASFTAPANVTISASASDTDGTISKVDFFQGTTLLGTDTTTPYSFTWNNVAAGNYSLTARATDDNAATSTSSAVTVTVNAPPAGSVTSPVNGATFTAPANITITANASDSDGTISKVDFYQGTTLIGTDMTSPYTISWNDVAAGSHSLTASATDNLGATSTSTAVNITVNAPPAASVINPTTGASFTAPTSVTISANANDSDGSVTRVDFYQGTALIGTDATSPYTITWNNVTAGSYSLTAKATDNLGAQTDSIAVSITVTTPPTVADIRWVVTDQLGTPRMSFDQTGSLANASRHDYLPFGEELTAGSRMTTPGYGTADGARQRFTSKERDIETGLDYFGARYYAGAEGRFTSCDPLMLGAKQLINPQRWNRYAYVVNNPLALYDPDGQDDQGKGGGKVIDIFLSHDPALKGDDRMIKRQQQRLDKVIAEGRRKGIQINVHDGFNATADDAARVVAKPGSIVIFGVHSGQDGNTKQYLGPYTDSGILGRGGVEYVNDKGQWVRTPTDTPRADLVVALSCESASFAGTFEGAKNFIGVQSDPSTFGLNNAIIATVDVIVRANGTVNQDTLNAIQAGAQSAIRNNPLQGNPDPNASVVVNPPARPPSDLEQHMRIIPPEE